MAIKRFLSHLAGSGRHLKSRGGSKPWLGQGYTLALRHRVPSRPEIALERLRMDEGRGRLGGSSHRALE
jgi:hypothetical protein